MYHSSKDNFNEHRNLKFGELFAGLKDTNKARTYSFVALSRRALFVFFLVGFSFLSELSLVAGMAFIQIIYLAYIIMLRPFDNLSNNIIEIINEIFYLVLIILLFYLTEESIWTDFASKVYLGIIVGNTMLIGLVVLSNRQNIIYIVTAIYSF
jgi:hypothetical protein